jgi:hypothetical protein
MTAATTVRRRDEGAILPLVLVVSVVLSFAVVALATFVATDLKYARVAHDRADRQATATSAITYGVDRIRLGQSLCSTSGGGFPAPPADVLDRNDTTTTLTCSRVAAGLSDITGWALIMTGQGISSDILNVKGGGTKVVTGPMFVNDVDEISFQGDGQRLDHTNGDLWHHRSTCPGPPLTISDNYSFIPADVRGPICTTSTWDQIVSAPTLPALGVALPVKDGSFTPEGSCRVFEPGHYTVAPDIGSADSYFRSGEYHFDDIGTFEVRQQTIWFGHPGALSGSEELSNSNDCEDARDLDPNIGGPGATAYLGGDSRFEVGVQGQMEFFPRTVDARPLSLQEIEPGFSYAESRVTAASNTEIVSIGPGLNKHLVFHGQVYTPNGWFSFDNSSNTAKQKLLGGAVVSRMSIQASASASAFEISVAASPFESDLILTATSTSPDGASTTAQAVVEYRVDEVDPNLRVAINSLRIVD